MKKQFFFAAAAVAALASCSSSDDVLSTGAPEVGSSNEQVLIGVNAPVAVVDVTRGTGSVGGIQDVDNKWEGQHVNVYMFEQNGDQQDPVGTLALAKDATGNVLYGDETTMLGAEMITPGGKSWSGDPANPALALRGDYEVRYYANGKQYNFFGYHTGGATLGTPALDAAKKVLSADITIDGTNDVMLASTDKVADLGDPAPAGITVADLYSAKASRADVKPNLNFAHELTRLTFTVDGGTAAALKGTENILTTQLNYPTDPTLKAAWIAQVTKDTESGEPLHEGWYIDAIKVRSNSTGEIVLATLDPAAKQEITWTDIDPMTNPEAEFTLMQRPEPIAVYTAATAKAFNATLPGAVTTSVTNPITSELYTQEEADAFNASLAGAVKPGDVNPDPLAPTIVDKTANLVDLIPVQPEAVHAPATLGKPIGDALFVAPKPVTATYDITSDTQTSTTEYEILVEMHQYVPQYEKTAVDAGLVEQKYTLNKPVAAWKPVALNASAFGPQAIDVAAGKTTKGYSFNINITVYSAEKVELNSTLENWKDGGNTDISFE